MSFKFLYILTIVSLFFGHTAFSQDTLFIDDSRDERNKLSIDKWIRQFDSSGLVCGKLKGSFNRYEYEMAHRFFNPADSTLFNGILISQFTVNINRYDFGLSVYNIANGEFVSRIEYRYKNGKSNEIADSIISNDLGIKSPLNFRLIKSLEKFEGYCYSVTRIQDYEYVFYPSGNLKLKKHYTGKNEYYQIVYFENGNLAGESKLQHNENIQKHYRKDLYENGQLHYYEAGIVDDSNNVSFSESCELDENGDTLFYSAAKNGEVHGLHYEQFVGYDGISRTHITKWAEGQLIDILSDDVMYIGKNYKIISEEKYILEHKKFNPENSPLEVLYPFVKFSKGPILTCYYSMARRSRKEWRTIRKIAKKHKI